MQFESESDHRFEELDVFHRGLCADGDLSGLAFGQGQLLCDMLLAWVSDRRFAQAGYSRSSTA
jgi:hypothetical protein